MKFNLAKKREGVSEGAWPGGYFVPFHNTLGGSEGFSGFPEEKAGFWGGNVAGGRSHLPLFTVTQGLQEHLHCKSFLLLHTFFINIAAITVHFLILLLFPVNCSYLNP